MRRKLLIGLTTAGLFLAGFGGAVVPASAEPHHFLLELANGVSVPWTGEPGAAPTSIAVAGVSAPVVSVQDLGAVAQQAAPTVPPPPPAPAPPAPAPEPAAPKPSDPAPSTSTSKPSTSQAPSTTSGGSSQPQPKAAGTATRQPSSTEPKAAKAPVAGNREQQETIGARRAKKSQAAREGSKAKKAEKAKARKPAKKTVDPATDAKTVDAPPAHAAPPAATNPSFSLAQPGAAPVGVPNFFIDKFRIPPFLLPIYQAAGVQYGIRWEILAAINEIETDYGRNLNVSSAGAVGWMQFMPATWEMYGTDANKDGVKDPFNPVDAIFASARYLRAAGADTDIRKAIFAYNHADWYVDSVILRATRIKEMPDDLVSSLTGLTEGRFPVAARARYADDIDPTKATRRVTKGNAAIPVESERTRRGINIYAKAGSPVIAVQDGRIVKIGNNER